MMHGTMNIKFIVSNNFQHGGTANSYSMSTLNMFSTRQVLWNVGLAYVTPLKCNSKTTRHGDKNIFWSLERNSHILILCLCIFIVPTATLRLLWL